MKDVHLREYSECLTVGPRREYVEEYQDWKRSFVRDFPELRREFATLERPRSWGKLFDAMGRLNWTQSDVYEHVREYEDEGRHLLVAAIREAIESEPAFQEMEHG